MIHPTYFGLKSGRTDQLRQMLGMTVDEYMTFKERQVKAYYRILQAEQDLINARKEYFASCIVPEKAEAGKK
jgi:hypothetical protein